jgi:predicted transcriptional regulator
VPVSFANVAQQFQQAAMAAGLADYDTSVVMTIIERLAAVEVSRPEQSVAPTPSPAR